MDAWTFLWLMVFLKIPIVGLFLIVRWAVRQTPEAAHGGDGGIGPRTTPPHPHPPRAPPPPSPPRPRPPSDRLPATRAFAGRAQAAAAPLSPCRRAAANRRWTSRII